MLTAQQEKAAHQTDCSLIVTANAGSGKTRVLVERIRYLISEKGVAPYKILAFTFTEKAAGEMKERLLAQKVVRADEESILSIGTLHGFLNRFLKKNSLRLNLDPDFEIVDENRMTLDVAHRLHQELANELGQEHNPQALSSDGRGPLGHSLITPWIQEHGFTKLHASLVDLVKNSTFFARPNPDPQNPLICWIRHFYTRYQKDRIAAGKLFFDDLETLSLQLLENISVRAQLQMRYSHILVDEFQDTSPLQASIIQHLFNIEHNKLFVVGDPKQSIYRFRQADIRYFNQFEQLIVQTGGESLELPHTFRMAPNLVEKINQVFEPLFSENNYSKKSSPKKTSSADESEKRMNTERPTAPSDKLEEKKKTAYTSMLAGSQTHEGSLRICKLPSSGADATTIRSLEARFIAQDIAQKIPRTEFGQTALLLRQGSFMPFYQQALTKAGIPSHITKTDSLLNSLFIKDLLLLTDYFWGQPDAVTRLGILRSPLFGFSEHFVEHYASQSPPDFFSQFTPSLFLAESDRHSWQRFSREMQRWQALSDKMPALDLVHLIHIDISPRLTLAYNKSEQELAMEFSQWVTFSQDLIEDNIDSLETPQQILQKSWMQLRETQTVIRKSASVGSSQAVQILTIHAAKGLEFDHVYLPQLYARPKSSSPLFMVDDVLGLVMKESDWKNPTGLKIKYPEQALFNEMKEKNRHEEREEVKRLLYVAMTRAKKNLVLFLKEPGKKSLIDVSLPGEWLSLLLSKEVTTQSETIPSSFENLVTEKSTPTFYEISLDGFYRPEFHAGKNNLIVGPKGPSFFRYETPLPTLDSAPKTNSWLHQYSVSELETQLRCPMEYELKYRRRLVPASGTFHATQNHPLHDHKDLPASVWGLLMHEVLQFLAPDGTSNSDTVIEQALFNQHVSDVDGMIKTRILQTLKNLYAHPSIGALLKTQTGRESEIPFILKIEDSVLSDFIPEKTRPLGADNKIVFSGMKLGAVETAPRSFILKGSIDRWVEMDGRLWVIDYKTDFLESYEDAIVRSQNYWGQLAAYILATRQIYPDAKLSSALIFTHSPAIISQEWDEEKITQARLTLSNLHRAIAKPVYPLPYADNSKTCQHCAYYPANYCGVRNSR